MTNMLSEVYTAFREAGSSEEAAQSAAQALSSDLLATRQDVIQGERALGNKIEQGNKATQTEILRVEKDLGNKIEQGDKAVLGEVTRVEKAVTAEVVRVEKDLGNKIEQGDKAVLAEVTRVEKTLGDRITCVERELAVLSWMARTTIGMVAALIIKSFWPI